jgi:hypothetical protein
VLEAFDAAYNAYKGSGPLCRVVLIGPVYRIVVAKPEPLWASS